MALHERQAVERGARWPLAVSCFGVSFLVVVLGVMPVIASAATPAWVIQSTPTPKGAGGGGLSDASCISATACTAVGVAVEGSTVVTTAEAWNGTKWAIEATPNPTGATTSSLDSVSCTSKTACTAVGYYYDSTGNYPLAERWNGTKWVIEATPNPQPGTTAELSELSSVSCTSAKACTAVGYYTNRSFVTVPLAERWNGTTWAVETTAFPSGATLASLAAVSCTSGTACTAVGRYKTSSNIQRTLAEAWNGTRWAIEATPNPSGTTTSALAAVSCHLPTACTAVGSYEASIGHTRPLAEILESTKWVIETTPGVSGTTVVLSGVSCTRSTTCTAVGSDAESASSQVPVAESLNGKKWALDRTPSRSHYSQLLGVSCTAATVCTAVGYSATSSQTLPAPLAERYS